MNQISNVIWDCDPALKYPAGNSRFGIQQGVHIPDRSNDLRKAGNLNCKNIRRLKTISSMMDMVERGDTVEAVARCWISRLTNKEHQLGLHGNSLLFGTAMLRSMHDARMAFFPTQQERPTIKALVEFGKRISMGNPQNLLARLPEFTRAVACTLSAHARTHPDKDAIYRLRSMNVAEFIDTFKDYRTAKEWNITRKSKDSFLDCYQESFLQLVGTPRYEYEALDRRLELWCEGIKAGMSIRDYEKSIAKTPAKKHPHLVAGNLMRIHFVVIFAELGNHSRRRGTQDLAARPVYQKSGECEIV